MTKMTAAITASIGRLLPWLVGEGSLARLRQMTRDLRVHPDVVQRARQNGHRHRPGVGAVLMRIAVVVPLPGGNRANDQPYHKKDRSDTHRCLHYPRCLRCEACEVSHMAHRYRARRPSNKPQANGA